MTRAVLGKRHSFTSILTGMMAAVVAAVVPATGGASACERVIVSGDPEFPPFSWYDGKILRGAGVDIAALVLQQLKLPYEVRYVGPFPRVLLAARNGSIDLINELKNTPERYAYLAFPRTPIFINPVAVFTRRDGQFAYRTWDDLVGRRGGITLANKFGGGFDEFLESRLSIEQAPRIEPGFAMLARGRIDYFVTSYYPGISHLMEANREAEIVALQPFVTSSDNFFGLSKISPCIGRLDDIDRTLAELVKSGEVKRIVDVDLALLRQFPARPPD